MKTKENNGRSSPINPVLSRTLEFVESKGSLSYVASNLGFASNLFTNMRKRNTKPSLDVVEAIANKYQDFDVNYIVTGKQKAVSAEIESLRAELERERVISEALATKVTGKPQATIDSLLVDEESEAFGTFTEENFPVGIIPFEGMILIAKYRDAEFIFPNCSHN